MLIVYHSQHGDTEETQPRYWCAIGDGEELGYSGSTDLFPTRGDVWEVRFRRLGWIDVTVQNAPSLSVTTVLGAREGVACFILRKACSGSLCATDPAGYDRVCKRPLKPHAENRTLCLRRKVKSDT
jgi:hypothetical protein